MRRTVLGKPLREPEQPFRDGLVRALWERLEPFVHLDAWDDAARSEKLRERRALVSLLREGLRVEDHARKILLDAGRREEHVAEPAAHLRAGLDAVERKALLVRALLTLIRGEYALAGTHQRACGIRKVSHERSLACGTMDP